MAQTKKKKTTIRRKAGHSPIPHGKGGSSCGHTRCKESCVVRYCGPTTHVSHHHAFMAARGVENIWLATIIAGLALLITGVLAFNAAQAEEAQQDSIREAELRGELIREIRSVKEELNSLEQSIRQAGY